MLQLKSFWSSNKYDVMLTENATSVQYFKSLLSRKQKSVVSKSTFAIKKEKSWSFVTFILDLVVRHSVNQHDERHILSDSSTSIFLLAKMTGHVLSCISGKPICGIGLYLNR